MDKRERRVFRKELRLGIVPARERVLIRIQYGIDEVCYTDVDVERTRLDKEISQWLLYDHPQKDLGLGRVYSYKHRYNAHGARVMGTYNLSVEFDWRADRLLEKLTWLPSQPYFAKSEGFEARLLDTRTPLEVNAALMTVPPTPLTAAIYEIPLRRDTFDPALRRPPFHRRPTIGELHRSIISSRKDMSPLSTQKRASKETFFRASTVLSSPSRSARDTFFRASTIGPPPSIMSPRIPGVPMVGNAFSAQQKAPPFPHINMTRSLDPQKHAQYWAAAEVMNEAWKKAMKAGSGTPTSSSSSSTQLPDLLVPSIDVPRSPSPSPAPRVPTLRRLASSRGIFTAFNNDSTISISSPNRSQLDLAAELENIPTYYFPPRPEAEGWCCAYAMFRDPLQQTEYEVGNLQFKDISDYYQKKLFPISRCAHSHIPDIHNIVNTWKQEQFAVKNMIRHLDSIGWDFAHQEQQDKFDRIMWTLNEQRRVALHVPDFGIKLAWATRLYELSAEQFMREKKVEEEGKGNEKVEEAEERRDSLSDALNTDDDLYADPSPLPQPSAPYIDASRDLMERIVHSATAVEELNITLATLNPTPRRESMERELTTKSTERREWEDYLAGQPSHTKPERHEDTEGGKSSRRRSRANRRISIIDGNIYGEEYREENFQLPIIPDEEEYGMGPQGTENNDQASHDNTEDDQQDDNYDNGRESNAEAMLDGLIEELEEQGKRNTKSTPSTPSTVQS